VREPIGEPLAAQLDRLGRAGAIVGVTGLVLGGLGGFLAPGAFFRGYLIGFVFVAGIALGALAILMLHHLTGGAWGLVVRRVLEAATRTLPLVAAMFVPLIFGLTELYIWARPEVVQGDPLLQEKQLYLNRPFFLARTAFYFAAWNVLAFFLSRWSREQDENGATATTAGARRFRLLSAPGLVVYGATVTFASIDWVMSLDPHWFSTIFGVIFMGGQGLSALAFAVAILVLLSRHEPFAGLLTPSHLHDLGKLLLAFVMLWAYFSFSQFLIIWSGNLPEEIPWYVERLHGGWQALALLILVGHFVAPFLLLLSRDLKRKGGALARVALALLAMRFVDLVWMVAPALPAAPLWQHAIDLAVAAGLAGIWLAVFARQLAGRPVLPVRDPYFKEALADGAH
jgi:hypothetical protein